jgi:hypothetical protein
MSNADSPPEAPPSPAPVRAWITLAEASRLSGRPVSAIKSAALAGSIRTHAVAGLRVLYSADDAKAVAMPRVQP